MCGRLVNLDTVARVLAEYYHLKTETQLAALDEALSKVPAVSVGGGHGKDHVADPNKMVGDLISRRAAIDAFLTELTKRERKNLLHTWSTVEVKYFVVDMLEKLPSAQPSATDTNVATTDTISRQQAIATAVSAAIDWHRLANPQYSIAYSIGEAMRALPSAQQERKKGKWIYNSPVTMKCDQCGFVIKDWDWHRFKFCPNCGADMRGEQDE